MYCYFFISRTSEKEEFRVRESNNKYKGRPRDTRVVSIQLQISLRAAREEKGDKIFSIFYSSKGMVCI
jgi:hypothetical protein